MRVSWPARLGVVAAAGLALALGSAPAAWAVSTVSINPAHVPTTAQAFSSHDCSDFPGITSSQDGWHFVLPAATGDNFLSVTLTFSTPGGTVTATITSSDSSNPSTGPGWSGYLDNAGAAERHAYLVTDAGWTLTAGTAVVSENTDGYFTLSHTCPGTPTTPTPTPPVTTAPPVTTTAPKPTGGPDTGGGGSQRGTGVVLGVGAVVLAGAAGAGLLVARRRRDAD
jgi:hypothetical protein